MSEFDHIFEQLSPARQDRLLTLARALLQEQQSEGPTEAGASPTGKRRGRPKGRKGGTYETVKSVRNSAGKVYRYRVSVTVGSDGKRTEKYLGRVD